MKGNNWGGKRAGAGRTEEAMLATLATKNKKQLYVLNTTEFNQLSAFDYKLVWKIDSFWGRFFLILQNYLTISKNIVIILPNIAKQTDARIRQVYEWMLTVYTLMTVYELWWFNPTTEGSNFGNEFK